MESKVVVQLSGMDANRVSFCAIDGKTGEILGHVQTRREYRHRRDIVTKSCEYLAKEILASDYVGLGS